MHQIARLKWGRVILASVAVFVLDILLITVVVTAYAFVLAFRVRGAPDQDQITQFAQHVGSSWGAALAVFLTVIAAIWVARKAPAAGVWHGVAVGVVVAGLGLLLGLTLNLRAFIEFVLTAAAGSLGGVIGGRIATKRRAAASSESESG